MKIIYREKDNQALRLSEEGAAKLLKGKGYNKAPKERPYKPAITLTEEAEKSLLEK